MGTRTHPDQAGIEAERSRVTKYPPGDPLVLVSTLTC